MPDVLHYIAPTIATLAFVTFGVSLLRISRGRAFERRTTALMGLIFTLAGIAIGYGLLFRAPSISQRRVLVEESLRSPPHEIVRMTLLPSKERSLVETPVTISDPTLIREIAAALNHSTSFALSHPRIIWTAKLEIEARDYSHTIQIQHTDQDQNGTFVFLQTASGWVVGSYRADRLHPLLRQAAYGVQSVELPGFNRPVSDSPPP